MMRSLSDMPGILLVAFGVTTRYGKPALATFTEKVRAAFPGHPVRWAFTARHKAKRPTLGGEPGMNAAKALSLFRGEGVTRIAVQPLHLIPGREHAALCRAAAAWQKRHPEVTVATGGALLADDEAMRAAIQAMLRIAGPRAEPDEAVIWVGHGSRDISCAHFARMAALAEKSAPHLYMGHIANGGNSGEILAKLTAARRTKARLISFFTLSGYHAARDVAGKGENSWRSRLQGAGVQCRVTLRGMLEHEDFAAMWLARLGETMARLKKNGDGTAP